MTADAAPNPMPDPTAYALGHDAAMCCREYMVPMRDGVRLATTV
jgi:predicted acyl esterase